MSWIHFLLLFLEGFLLALILTPLMRMVAPWLGFLDHPGERKVHSQSKPLLGGAAIYFSFLIIVFGNIILLFWLRDLSFSGETWLSRKILELTTFTYGVRKVSLQLMGILFGSLLLFIVGLMDDRFGLSPWIKLIGQIIATIILYCCEIHIALFISNGFINFGLTLFWVVLISNSFNLLDNMDGLSGGVAMITLILLGISAYLVDQQVFMSSITFALAGCIAGFLRYNLNPSSIFMGDAGSLVVGFLVASLTVLSTYYQSGTENATAWAVVMPLIIFAVPLFDTLSVIFIRLKNGKPIYVGDKNHFSHRLVGLGMSPRRAVFFIHLVTLCVGSGALILPLLNEPFGAYVILTQIIIIFILITMLEHIKNNNHGN